MSQKSLNDNAIRTELVESVCDDLAAIKRAVPVLIEEHLIAAAYQSARRLGWGEDESELKSIFRRVAICLRWPVPNEVAK
jgi:hypothetical protein